MKYKPGDVLEYEIEPGESLRILGLVFRIKDGKYHCVTLGYTIQGKELFFWDTAEGHDFSTFDPNEITGKRKIDIILKLKHDIMHGLFVK